jgi:hypothetical protein
MRRRGARRAYARSITKECRDAGSLNYPPKTTNFVDATAPPLRRNALDRPVLRVRVRSRAVAPVEVAVELGRAGAQVVQRQLGFVGLALGIISERAPPNRIMVVAAEQPARFDHRVGNHSAHLIEHQSLDRAELCAVAPVDGDVLTRSLGTIV